MSSRHYRIFIAGEYAIAVFHGHILSRNQLFVSLKEPLYLSLKASMSVILIVCLLIQIYISCKQRLGIVIELHKILRRCLSRIGA